MNPFVNLKKRSISLPTGCNDLVDVLKLSEKPKHDSAIRRFIHLILLQAQRCQATELIIGEAPPAGVTPVKYKVVDIWYDFSGFASHIRPDVVSELARMAKFPEGEFPKEGILEVRLGDVQLKWVAGMTSADGECRLARIQD